MSICNNNFPIFVRGFLLRKCFSEKEIDFVVVVDPEKSRHGGRDLNSETFYWTGSRFWDLLLDGISNLRPSIGQDLDSETFYWMGSRFWDLLFDRISILRLSTGWDLDSETFYWMGSRFWDFLLDGISILRLSIGPDLNSETFYWMGSQFWDFLLDGISILRFSTGWRPAPREKLAATYKFNSERLETDHFCCWMGSLFQLFSRLEPGRARKSQVELKTQNQKQHTETSLFLQPKVLFESRFQSGWIANDLGSFSRTFWRRNSAPNRDGPVPIAF